MTTINLLNDTIEIKRNGGILDDSLKKGTFNYFSFPDGQPHISFPEPIDRKEGVRIVCRIRNEEELFKLRLVADVANRCSHVEEIEILYLMAARTDRILSFEEPFTLKMVAEDINKIGARVLIHEPHSDESLRLINRGIAKRALVNEILYGNKYIEDNTTIVYPDKGAYLRYSWMYKAFNSLVCRKTRNPKDGSLSGFSIINPELYKEGPMIVLDDLCDGGGTFLGIEEKLRVLNPPSITLAVTHAVQKKGIERVAEVYDKVIITNSYEDWEDLPRNVEMIDLIHK